MELFNILLPFFLLGFAGAVVARFTGVAISLLLLPSILYLGATPVETVVFMLTFLVYNNFTLETQNVRLDFKELTFFNGWRKYAVLGGALITTVFAPFIAITLFLVAFIMEVSALLYRRIPSQHRPPVKDIMKYAIASMVTTVIGVFAVQLVPAVSYVYLAGVAILIYTTFAWYAGVHREAFRNTWLWIWATLGGAFLGLFGIDGTSYLGGLKRTFPSKGDRMFGVVSMISSFTGLVVIFALYQTYSLLALVASLGAAIGTRLLGVYEFNNRGGFSYLAIAMTVFVVLCLFLTQPIPVGLPPVDVMLNNLGK